MKDFIEALTELLPFMKNPDDVCPFGAELQEQCNKAVKDLVEEYFKEYENWKELYRDLWAWLMQVLLPSYKRLELEEQFPMMVQDQEEHQ